MTRKTDGTFAKGTSGNPAGRPPKEREEKYHAILLSRVTFADWERIIDKAVEQAKRGDSTARKWLADYLVGPPVERKEVTGDAGGPIEIVVRYERRKAISEDDV